MTTNHPRRFKVLGTTDAADGCDCCGRRNLKVYVALEPVDGGPVVFYGTGCAANAENVPAAEIRVEARTADDDRRAGEAAARKAAHDAEEAVFAAWAVEHGATVDGFGNVHPPAGVSVWNMRVAWHDETLG